MSEHDELRDAAGPWVLGALAEDDAWRFQHHLEVCASCRDEVERLRVAAEALPLAAPPIEPPPELKQRLMAIVEAEAAERTEEAEAPARPARERRASWWRTWLDAVSARPALAAAAAAALIVVGGIVGFAVGGNEGGPAGKTISAQVATQLGGARAELIRSGRTATLRVSDMPAPPRGRVWQVWVQHAGRPPKRDAFFTVDRSGRGSVQLQADVAGAQAIMVTDEPLGATAPSSSPVITARPA